MIATSTSKRVSWYEFSSFSIKGEVGRLDSRDRIEAIQQLYTHFGGLLAGTERRRELVVHSI